MYRSLWSWFKDESRILVTNSMKLKNEKNSLSIRCLNWRKCKTQKRWLWFLKARRSCRAATPVDTSRGDNDDACRLSYDFLWSWTDWCFHPIVAWTPCNDTAAAESVWDNSRVAVIGVTCRLFAFTTVKTQTVGWGSALKMNGLI